METPTPGASPSFLEAYEATREGAAFVRHSDAGFFLIEGKDALDLLNRISTNDLRQMEKREVRSTVLVTEKGRIVDLVTVIPYGQGYLLEVSKGNEDRILRWIGKFIIMEDVQLRPANIRIEKSLLIGPQVQTILSEFGVDIMPGPKAQLQEIPTAGSGIHVFRSLLYPGEVWSILWTQAIDSSSKMLRQLQTIAQEIGGRVLQTYRVEEGIPQPGNEMNDQVNPLEAGLDKFVSLTKGCYLGQEVIARLDTYSKLQRRLRGFAGEFAESEITDGDAIDENGETVGWITSHTFSPLIGKCVALGYLKTTARAVGLTVQGRNGTRHGLSPVTLPIRAKGSIPQSRIDNPLDKEDGQ